MSARPIGIDLRMWRHPGIGRYVRELLSAILRMEKAERFLFLAKLEDEQAIFAALGPVRYEKAETGIYGLEEQKELYDLSKKVELLHVPHFNAPLFCSSRLVVTLHDLIYLKESRFSGSMFGQWYVKMMLGGIQRNARAVITVSDFTRRDLEASFPKLTGKVEVVHEAAALCFRAEAVDRSDLVKRKHGIEKDFVLFVGSLKAHKNLSGLLDAFERLLNDKRADAQLVIVGRPDPKEKALLERVKAAAPSVVYLGERPDSELVDLYRAARVLVVPSFWEGFGLTAVEGMACGTPVIVSERASLPEVVGDAGLLFNPERVDQLEQLLYNVLNDRNLRQELSKKGLARARCFSWENAARQTLGVYEKSLA